MKKRKPKRSAKPKNSSLVKMYDRFFSPLPSVSSWNSALYEREDVGRARTYVTYSIGERPLVNFSDA